jgi:uncharacterized protein with von Willebrand factor type A (vWA) domain
MNAEPLGAAWSFAGRWAYRRWDGTQEGRFAADDLFGEIADDLLYHGDPEAALRRLLMGGFRRRDGERVLGLRELIERVRKRREAALRRYDPNGTFRQVREALQQILDTERRALDRLEADAEASGDPRRMETARQTVNERRLELGMLPDHLAGQLRALEHYEFVSSEAKRAFDELLERLREQVARAWFDQMAEALSNPDPQALERVRQALDALNRMLDQRARGEPLDPTFEEFMARFGDLFPGNPASLDELLEQLAAQIAAAEAALASMSPEMRAQLMALAEALFEDLDLRWQVERLAEHLRQAVPDAGWGRRYRFGGSDPLGLAELTELTRSLGELDRIEEYLRDAASPGALAEVDLESVREQLGDDAAQSIEQLRRLARELEDAGLIANREGRFELTAKGIRRIGQRALGELFSRLASERLGGHERTAVGVGHDVEGTTKPWEFGDPLTLDIERTVRNALARRGQGTPVRLVPEDFEVVRHESLVRASTVMLLDLSLSMPMRDNFLAAKKVAIALATLIATRFPRDYLAIVGFSEVAREIRPEELPEVSWDFVYGTNMQHGLMLARRLLAGRPGTRQVVMITDGEPTAHLVATPDGGYEPFFSYPPIPETVRATLAEVARCTKAGITINTFMLDANRALRSFVEHLTRLNGGRAFFTTPENLGSYVLVDFLERRRHVRAQRPGA